MSCNFYLNSNKPVNCLPIKRSIKKIDKEDDDEYLHLIKSFLNQIVKKEDSIFDKLQKEIVNSTSIDKLKDGGEYQQRILNIDLRELSNGRKVERLQEIRKTRLNNLQYEENRLLVMRDIMI